MPDLDTQQKPKIWFYRNYQQFSGGHLKHAHYFRNTQSYPDFSPRICFEKHAAEPPAILQERSELWQGDSIKNWTPEAEDIFFIAGTDWRYLDKQGLAERLNTRINLIQHVRHAHENTELLSYLKRKAIRICVSQEVADAIHDTGIVNGPVIVIPNGVDLKLQATAAIENDSETDKKILIVGYKNQDFASQLSERLGQKNIEYQLNLALRGRADYLEQLDEFGIVLCLPHAEEGFYLPALETMALGKLTITMDCIGNRSFCLPNNNCLVAEYTLESAVACIQNALSLEKSTRNTLRLNGIKTAKTFSMQQETEKYHHLLKNLADLC